MLHRWLLRQITPHRVAHRTTSYTTAAATSSRPRPPFDESPAPRKPVAPCPRSLAASRRRYMSCCGLQRSWRRRRRGRSRTAGGDPQTRGSNRGRNACSRVTRTSSLRSLTQNAHPRRLARLLRARSPQDAKARGRPRRLGGRLKRGSRRTLRRRTDDVDARSSSPAWSVAVAGGGCSPGCSSRTLPSVILARGSRHGVGVPQISLSTCA
jgi:hypothetical protein